MANVGTVGKQLGQHWVVVYISALVGCAAMLMLLCWRPGGSAPRCFITPPFGGEFDGPIAISPDGKWIAGSLSIGGRTSLALVDIAGRRSRILSGTAGGRLPFWSPDGQSIGFFATRQLKRVDVGTGLVTTLCEAAEGKGGTWSPEGIVLFAPTATGPLYRVPANGGSAVPATTLDAAAGEIGHSWPQFLPGGRFLLSASSGSSDDARICVASLDGDRKLVLRANGRVMFTSSWGGALIYSQDKKLLSVLFDATGLKVSGVARLLAPMVAYSRRDRTDLFTAGPGVVAYQNSDPDRVRQLVWMQPGKAPQPIGEPARYSLPRVSPEGRQILVARSDATGRTNLWLMDAATGEARQLTSERQRASHPVWAPDGRQYLYAAVNTDTYMIMKGAIGAARGGELVLRTDRSIVPTDWSGAGPSILFGSLTSEFYEIRTAALSTPARSRAVVSLDHQNALGGRISPDGNWIAFTTTSREGSGPYEVHIARLQQGATASGTRMSTSGGFDPEWSRDGSVLYYVTSDRRLLSVKVQAGASFQTGPAQTVMSVGCVGHNRLEYEPGFGYSPVEQGDRFLFNMRAAEPERELTILHVPVSASQSPQGMFRTPIGLEGFFLLPTSGDHGWTWRR